MKKQAVLKRIVTTLIVPTVIKAGEEMQPKGCVIFDFSKLNEKIKILS